MVATVTCGRMLDCKSRGPGFKATGGANHNNYGNTKIMMAQLLQFVETQLINNKNMVAMGTPT